MQAGEYKSVRGGGAGPTLHRRCVGAPFIFPSSEPRGAPRPSRVKIGRASSVSGGYFQTSKALAGVLGHRGAVFRKAGTA